MKTAQVHRFRNAVAIYVGMGETVYLTAQAAADIAEALRACAENIRTEPSFAHSSFTTRAFVLEDGMRSHLAHHRLQGGTRPGITQAGALAATDETEE